MGVSSPAEDLLPVSDVEAGVNFRPAVYGGRLLVTYPEGNQAQVPGGQGAGAVTPFLHPEVPAFPFSVTWARKGNQDEAMGWKRVCGTAGIWVLKGDARARMLPAMILTAFGWDGRSRETYETACFTPGHDCPCSYAYGHRAAVRPQTEDPIWNVAISLWGRVARLLSPLVW